MRTTVTLEPDVVAYLQQLMEEQGLSFKTAINQAVRAAAAPTPAERVTVGTYRMGPAAVDLDHAQVATQVERRVASRAGGRPQCPALRDRRGVGAPRHVEGVCSYDTDFDRFPGLDRVEPS